MAKKIISLHDQQKPPFVSKDAQSLDDFLQGSHPDDLRAAGLRPWALFTFGEIWLFPGHWFHHIPEGFPLVDIWGQPGFFNSETLDPLTQEDALAFGFIMKLERLKGLRTLRTKL